MSHILIFAHVVGCFALLIGTLKRIESDPPLAFVPRAALLFLALLALLAAIEMLARHDQPLASTAVLIFVWGIISLWRAFAPPGACWFAALTWLRPPSTDRGS